MDIGIHVSRLSGQRLRVGPYLEYVLKYWSGMLPSDERVHACLREPVAPASIAHLGLGPSIQLDYTTRYTLDVVRRVANS